MKKLFLFLLMLTPTMAMAGDLAVATEAKRNIKLEYTMTWVEKETPYGFVGCMVTTAYHKSGSAANGSSTECNFALHNCTYLNMCPSSGGSGSSDTILQAILEELQKDKTVTYPWSKGMSKRKHK